MPELPFVEPFAKRSIPLRGFHNRLALVVADCEVSTVLDEEWGVAHAEP